MPALQPQRGHTNLLIIRDDPQILANGLMMPLHCQGWSLSQNCLFWQAQKRRFPDVIDSSSREYPQALGNSLAFEMP